jgi:hypothetical protein
MFDKRTSASLQAAFLFLIVGSPLVYNLTNKLLSGLFGKLSSNGCATCNGLVLHAVVFGLITYALMCMCSSSHNYIVYGNSTRHIETQDPGVTDLNKTHRNPPVTPPHLPAQLAAEMGPKMM